MGKGGFSTPVFARDFGRKVLAIFDVLTYVHIYIYYIFVSVYYTGIELQLSRSLSIPVVNFQNRPVYLLYFYFTFFFLRGEKEKVSHVL